jgi:hypothetical protein
MTCGSAEVFPCTQLLWRRRSAVFRSEAAMLEDGDSR